MMRIGITGGIGSGKTTVCNLFASLGVPVYHADTEARKLYTENPQLKSELIAAFGAEVYTLDEINKQKLRSLVFGNPESGKKLNAIVHPYVFSHYEEWCKQHNAYVYTLKEAAILFESGSYRHLHAVIGVSAPQELRIARTMQRDGLNREDVLKRIDAQMPQEELLARCQYIIVNDGLQELNKQVQELHDLFIQKPSLHTDYLP
ncbi:MAG: dephospho-CoA kinase [Bacteroidetes bacterium]|nr:dephospho-CoA kinase [Bacteroidota bacterium]